jgi:pimeloyl-ACP methyl ester carboxylesterase
MGAGHCAYTTEIAYYCNKGYVVLAYDNYGCDRSEGKNIRSFYAGAECVIAAYIAAKKDERLKDKPTFLVGHSWGAYSVLCASEKINVDGVVAFSPFAVPSKICRRLLKGNLNSLVVAIISPMLWLIHMIYGNKNAAKAIVKSTTPAMIIWGEKDVAVDEKNSVAAIVDGQNITKVILPDKGHNPYNTVAAESKLAELVSAIGNKETSDDFFKNFDFSAATQEDEVVMQKTVDFIEGIK